MRVAVAVAGLLVAAQAVAVAVREDLIQLQHQLQGQSALAAEAEAVRLAQEILAALREVLAQSSLLTPALPSKWLVAR